MFLLPDAELWATGYVREWLADADEEAFVGNRVPDQRRPRMVIVRRDGGRSPEPARDVPRIAVRVWGATEQDATDLTSIVRAGLAAAAGDGPCRRVEELSGPTPIPDESGQPQRYLLWEFVLRGAEVA